ncbi:SRPBCC family protein [Micromonospora sp. NPDC003197]
MRYADGPHTQSEILIAAPLPRVWELVVDIELPARLSDELHRVEWLDGAAEPTLGARFLGYNRNRWFGEWRMLSQVVELEPCRVFAWAAMDVDGRFGPATDDLASGSATWRFDLEPEAEGVRLRESVRIGPGRSGLSLAIERFGDEEKQVSGRLDMLRESMQRTLAGIKALAEADR